MLLKVREQSTCRYNEVSLGEVMLRLDPGEGRVRTARSFRASEGGGEYNVARGLAKCFGMRTAVVTALAENDIGYLLEELIAAGKVDTGFIQWKSFDGIGRTSRNGLNFTERGYGIRGAIGVSDRANTATSQMKRGDVDWEKLFGELGSQWLHTGGIYAALSESTGDVALEAMQAAKKHGTIVSYDLNYRPSLWNSIGGLEQCRKVNRELAKYVDVMIGNEEDFTACLGFEIEGNEENLKELNIDGYKRMVERAASEYPNFKVIATTLRTVKTATINDWSAIIWYDGKVYKARQYDNLEILDRVGGGDSFASGVIYGLMNLDDPQQVVEYGAAHGALAMTTQGDTTTARLSEVKKLVAGGSARVQR